MDGIVTIGGCDKNMPGMMMAAIRTDLPSVFLYGGSIMPGEHDGREVTIQNVFEGVGAVADGEMSEGELDEMERHACPGAGSCGGMFTANTMASISEALGFAPLGSASPPAEHESRYEEARRAGELAVEVVQERRSPSDFLTRESFENAIALQVAVGGRPTPFSTCSRSRRRPASTSISRRSTKSAPGRPKSPTSSPAASGS